MPSVAATRPASLPASTGASLPTLRQGARSSTVGLLQTRLRALGVYTGAVDGAFGPKTLAAVKRFQKSKGLTADGVVGPATWARLGVTDRRDTASTAPRPSAGSGPTLRVGARGEAVRVLQERLRALGIASVHVDGAFGPGTLAAVKLFQKSKGLTADGVVGPSTWAKLGVRAATGSSGKNPYHADFAKAAQKAGVPTSWASNSALIQLVKHESSWNPRAKNPRSTAFGLFQFLTSTWRAYVREVPYGSTSPYWQAVGGFRYIRERYETPERAWAFWQATVKKNAALAPADLRDTARFWISRGYAGY